MSLTYNEILDKMKLAFFNECGKNVSNMSDVELRFKAAASEIYSAWANADYVLKQAFVQTASGKYLDMHAELRGITRKRSAKASGMLSFYVTEPLESDVIIPAGTICSVKGKPQLQFSTQSEAELKAGELTCTVQAEAINDGRESNAGAGEISVMVNPPEFIVGVTNESDFIGGSSDESDLSLRQRVMSSYNILSNAINQASVEELVMTLDDVLDCTVMLSSKGVLVVCVKTRGNIKAQDLSPEINNLLGFAYLCGVPVYVVPAARLYFTAFAAVKMKPGHDKEALEAKIRERITEACSAEKLGKSVAVSEIMRYLYDIEEAEKIEIRLFPSSNGVSPCVEQMYLCLKELQVEIYE